MKIAVLSDIHGNLEAFAAVQADLQQQGAKRVICLGDNIGYGPDPEAVVALLRQSGYVSVLGNHEFGLLDARGRRWFNPQAADNNIATERLLSEANMAYCCGLPTFLVVENGHFVHGYPPDSVLRYLDRQADDRITALFATTPASIYFVGHTHRLQLVTGKAGAIVRRPLVAGILSLARDAKYIVNCGSVGQPRDGDYRAKYLLWDCGGRRLEVRFVDYDNRTTMQKIRERGFPEIYATRLR